MFSKFTKSIKKPETFSYTQFYALFIIVVAVFLPFISIWLVGYSKSETISETLLAVGIILFVLEMRRLSK